MRFAIMHRTNAHWEGGALPAPELVTRVGQLIGQLKKAGAFVAGEGLRPSSEGVRLAFSGGETSAIPGPFEGVNELPAAFSILRARSLDEAIDWAARQAQALGDGEADIRPVTEPWDIGVMPRPDGASTRRYMVLRKATAATESGAEPTAGQRAAMTHLIEETGKTGVHLATETTRPSAKGRRYKNAQDGVRVFDGPFTETKELLGGYVIVDVDSLDAASRWAEKYIKVVGAEEVDVREME
jgi:hypothetical protein